MIYISHLLDRFLNIFMEFKNNLKNIMRVSEL